MAFRRESDEEHKEPRFELPIPPGENLVTERGLALIRAKVAEVEQTLAAAVDDEARQDQARTLRYWRAREATARIAPPPPADTVAFGARVRFTLAGRTRTIMIVGDDEADPAAGRIAFTAPLARALMRAEEGELVDFGGQSAAIEVIAIGDAA